MKKIILLFFVFVLSLSTVFGTFFSPLLAENPEITIYVAPLISTANQGGVFSVNITVANVLNLYAYEFRLSWEPSLLDLTSVAEGPFLNAEGTYMTIFTPRIYNTPDPFGISGYVYVACTLLGEPATAAASGSGTLATIEFLVKEEGNTSLHLYDTKLINSLIVEISHETQDGYFQSLPPPEIHVKPSGVVDPSLQPGNAFSINVTVIQAVGVYAWSLNMSWDPAVLNVTNVEEGSFLNQSAYGTTFNKHILQEEGFLYANCSLFGESPDVSASGNGTLVTVSFLVEAVGSTVLDLYDTKLLGYGGGELPHEVQDGYFDNSGVRRDVSIVSVEASPTTVEAGDSVSITVVAGNEGDVTENFDVIVYWGDINIGTVSTSDLSPGSQKTLTFSWKTEGMVEGNHTIEAVASAVIWEANTDDNTYVNGYVTITPPEETSSLPVTLIAAVVIVILIVVAVIGVMFLRKRR